MSDNIRPWRGTLPALGQRVYVDPAAVVIGRVTLGDDSSVWPMAVIRGDINVIHVGARTSVQDGSVLHGCTVGNRCLIGMSALVMDGAVVEDEVVVGAGAVVTPGTRCESRSLYVGTPARRVRALTEREIAQLAYSAGW